MITTPRKSFGFLNRAAAFDPFPLQVPVFDEPPCRPAFTASPSRTPSTLDPTVSRKPRIGSLPDNGFKERQRQREEWRRLRNHQVASYLRRQVYAPVNPWSEEEVTNGSKQRSA